MRAILITCALLTTPSIAQGEPIENLTEALVKKRAATEKLTDDVEDQKRARRAQKREFTGQKAQLESELRRESVRAAQLREAHQRKRALVQSAKDSDRVLLPIFSENANRLKTYINASVPFRTTERLEAVKSLEERLESGLITPRDALTRLWALIEDEQRMSRENTMSRDTITVDGVEMMADVIRLGSVGVFFRTGTGRAGVIRKDEQGRWTPRFVEGDAALAQVSGLFDAFKRQIKTGFFTLPAFAPTGMEGR